MAVHSNSSSWIAIGLALLSLASTIYMQATHNDRENAQKISALESHRADDNSRLDRIESKLDHVIDWMVGHKP